MNSTLPSMAAAILALGPLTAAAQVTYVPGASSTVVGTDPNASVEVFTVTQPTPVVIVTPAPAAPVVTPVVVAPPPPPPIVTPVVAPPLVAPQPAPIATTELHFASSDGEATLISIYDANPSVSDYQAQCTTPCALEVENGSYEFMAGDHRTFEVHALGGVQYWEVEDNSLAGIVTGAVLTGIGGILALGGGLAIALEKDTSHYDSWYGVHQEPDLTAEWTVTGVGIGSAVLGLAIWLFSYGESEQVQSSGPYTSALDRFGILPILLADRAPTGQSRWGLGLRLRF